VDLARVLLKYIAGICSLDPIERRHAADDAGDLVDSLGTWEVQLLSRVLASAWLVDSDVGAQESELNALAEISGNWGLPAEVRTALSEADWTSVPAAHLEYLEAIRDGK